MFHNILNSLMRSNITVTPEILHCVIRSNSLH